MKVKIIKNVLNTTAFVTVDYLNQSNFSLELLFRCVGTRDRELLRELTLRTQLCQLGESFFPERKIVQRCFLHPVTVVPASKLNFLPGSTFHNLFSQISFHIPINIIG